MVLLDSVSDVFLPVYGYLTDKSTSRIKANSSFRCFMDKFLRSFISIEKSIQIATLIGLVVFLGYLGFLNYRSDRTPSVPVTSPTTQQ